MFRNIIAWSLIYVGLLFGTETTIETSLITVKLISSNATPSDMMKSYSRFCNQPGARWNNLQLTDADQADYYCILNSPMPGISFIPERTIFLKSEALGHHKPIFPDPWVHPDASQFLYFFDQWPAIGWHIDKTYDEWQKQKIKKTKLLSTLTSTEEQLPGTIKQLHFLNYLSEKGFDYDRYDGSNLVAIKQAPSSPSLNPKNEGLLPYKYTIVCENQWLEGYFTEKLTDAILAESLCFYWGCPNLEQYIDPRAFIRLDIDHPEEALTTIQKTIASKEWEKRLEVIRQEKRRILDQLQVMPVLEKIIQSHQQYESFAAYRDTLNPFYGDSLLLKVMDNLSELCQRYVETHSTRGLNARLLAKRYPHLQVLAASDSHLDYKHTADSLKGLMNAQALHSSPIELIERLAKETPTVPTLYYLDKPKRESARLLDEIASILQTQSYYIVIPNFRNFELTCQQKIQEMLPDQARCYFPSVGANDQKAGCMLITNQPLEDLLNRASLQQPSFYNDMSVRVINLDRRPDRWQRFVEQMNRQQLAPYSRFAAFDGQTLVLEGETEKLFRLDPAFKGKRWDINHGYCKGILGCCLSHMTLWQELVNSQEEAVLILEDDVTLIEGFVERWETLYKQHLRNDPEWDLIYLGFNDDTPQLQAYYGDTAVCEGVLRFSHTLRLEGSGTHAYCLRRKGAVKLLSLIQQTGMQQAIDQFLIDQFDQLTVYHTYPPLATAPNFGEGIVDSDIQVESVVRDVKLRD